MIDLEALSRETAALLGQPFEWCHVKGGSVDLEDASQHGGSGGGVFEIPDFVIAKYPITNAQYDIFLKDVNGASNHLWWDFSSEARQWHKDRPKPKPTAFAGETLPRTRVSWFDAMAYTRWLSDQLKSKLADFKGSVCLPTEQQWQRAAIGDTSWGYPWGKDFEKAYGNFANNVGQPTPVNDYMESSSPFDVVDMTGNVWEWCSTAWGPENPGFSSYSYRVIRGGAWNVSDPTYLRATERSGHPPRGRLNDCGFRCAFVSEECTA